MQFDLRRLDIYRKVPKDFTQPTLTGAVISVLSLLFITYLFIAELLDYITPQLSTEMFVEDPTTITERIYVKIDISILHLDCKYVGLDIQDDFGRHEVGFIENTDKKPINNNEGCRFIAQFNINRVPGNFHISTHGSREQPNKVNMQHVINELYFGEELDSMVAKSFPGSFGSLDKMDKSEANDQSSHDYFLKIVPSVVHGYGKHVFHPFQYTFAYRDYVQYGHGHKVNPAIWFRYALSPITVSYSHTTKPFYTFLTAVCAIVGGTFTVASIIDSAIYTAANVFKKAELGKLG